MSACATGHWQLSTLEPRCVREFSIFELSYDGFCAAILKFVTCIKLIIDYRKPGKAGVVNRQLRLRCIKLLFFYRETWPIIVACWNRKL